MVMGYVSKMVMYDERMGGHVHVMGMRVVKGCSGRVVSWFVRYWAVDYR